MDINRMCDSAEASQVWVFFSPVAQMYLFDVRAGLIRETGRLHAALRHLAALTCCHSKHLDPMSICCHHSWSDGGACVSANFI